MRQAKNETEALVGVKNWVLKLAKSNPKVREFYNGKTADKISIKSLRWTDFAAIRILDYIKHAGREFADLNLHGEIAVSNPILLLWLAVNQGTGGAKPAFFEDMLHLFRQLTEKTHQAKPSVKQFQEWMDRFPSGLDPRIVHLHQENRDRIINLLIKKIDKGEIKSSRFFFKPGLKLSQKYDQMLEWWDDYLFHLHFAVRDPDSLNQMLGESLDPDTLKILYKAKKAGIPFFVNPYYLSLLHVRVPYFAIGADLAIRDYVLYSQQLVNEFGNIVAWEKEDKVQPGQPNAAGWLLPSHDNIHRRYPEVAILIPDTMGRACGGLCASCQRMYSFQNGRLNFNLSKLNPKQTWPDKLKQLMKYFENDSQLRDILITGGDALMSSDKSIHEVLEAVYQMALNKKKANKNRPPGEKYAEILRVRLGTRLPVYLPQRISPNLTKILKNFKEKASQIGIRQFVIQTHIESPMEITPEMVSAVKLLLSAGWLVTNQLVFTAAASRRGHTAKLRQVLNDIGILPYYTFSVKGYMENSETFATNSRAMQEQIEEKSFGTLAPIHYKSLSALQDQVEKMSDKIGQLKKSLKLPFLSTDRNVLNLPGVGKSLSYRVVGITRYGRRILEFDHDPTRTHSPIIHQMGKVVIIESKSISEYLQQLERMGEDISDYEGIYGYSLGETELRLPIYEYPQYDFSVTDQLTNFQL